MKKAVQIIAVMAMLAIGFAGGRWYTMRGVTQQPGRKILYYVDPMHPSYKSDRPGIAPDCGMRLEPVYADQAAPAAQPQKKILYYKDPQAPQYRSDKPGLNPETGHDLVPVYDEPGPGTVTISAEKQQLIGITYGTVERASTESSIHAVGRVAWDETSVSKVNAKTDGWVDDVLVDYTGQPVRRGQPLLTIYSPELLASQQEYLLALRSKDIMRERGDALIAASRRRLQLWDVTDAQIDEIGRTGKPIRNVTVFSPVSGVVVERKVFPKQRITPETELYTIADLSRVWVVADVFEHDAPNVRIGQTATVSLTNAGSGSQTARVEQILPQVDPNSRTLKVRLSLQNQSQKLRPDMCVDVDFKTYQMARLTVPASAVLDTGERTTVFVDKGSGLLEPREVQTGARLANRIEIISGLSAGERIVTSGNFLLDSESQMKAAANDQPHH